METRGELSVIAFEVDSLQVRVSINPGNAFQTLHLRVTPDDPNQWQSDLLIQKLFDDRVSIIEK